MKKSHSNTRSQTQPVQTKAFFQKKAEGHFFPAKSDVQTKVQVGQSNDKYEREADQVANQVTSKDTPVQPVYNKITPFVKNNEGSQRKPEMPTQKKVAIKDDSVQKQKELQEKSQEETAQRKSDEAKPMMKEAEPVQQKEELQEKEEESTVQRNTDEGQAMKKTKPVQKQEEVQEKEEENSVQRAEDKEIPMTKQEEPAQMQEEVQEKKEETNTAQRKSDEGDTAMMKQKETVQQNEEVQEKEEEPNIQHASDQEKRIQKKEEIQEKKNLPHFKIRIKNHIAIKKFRPKSENANENLWLSQSLQNSKGKGSPFSSPIKSEMEANIGADFSKVRIHTGSEADKLSKNLNAKAFAHEGDIYFKSGNYDPNSQKGKHLLAHELTHTVQQGASVQLLPEKYSDSFQNENDKDQTNESGLMSEPDISIIEAERSRESFEIGEEKIAFEEPTLEASLAEEGIPEIDLNENFVEPPVSEIPVDEKEDVVEIENVGLEGQSNEVTIAVMNANPSQMAIAFPGLGGNLEGKLNIEKQQAQQEAPILKAQNNGKVEEGITPANKIRTPKDPEIKEKTEGLTPEVTLPPHVNFGETPNNKESVNKLDEQEESTFVSWLSNNFSRFISGIKTEDAGINTSAGESPTVDTSGDADVQRTDEQRKQTTNELKDERNNLTEEIKNNPGQQNIQPTQVNENYNVQLTEESIDIVKTEASEGMSDYANAALPEDVRNQADNLLAPNIQQNLNQSKGQVNQATQTRDSEKQNEFTHTKNENEQLNQQADIEQKSIVLENRKKVAEKQEEGIENAYEEVKSFDKETTEEQKKAKEDVKNKIIEKENEADKELLKGEKKAEEEKEKGKRQAEEKKKELEKKKEEKSFWGKITSAIKDAVKAITSAIDKIFTVVRDAVKNAIDFAKNLALKAIEAARSWIVDKLNKFRDWIKSKVSQYLKNFPALAAKINTAIDTVVDRAIAGVNAVADNLKKGVEALAKALTAALDKILSIYQTALKAAVQIAGAVLTGDFAEALRIAIQAACDIAGIDSAQVFGFLDKAKAQIMKILKDPVGFFKFLAKGVGDGIRNFVKPENLKKHLMTGLISWLTGTLSAIAIKLPEKFDLKGIFGLVMQILGLTYDNIKALVIKAYPPAEKMFSAIEKAFQWIPEIVTQGPIVLWEQLKSWVTNLKDMVIDGIRSFVTTKIIQEGITWLLSLVNPAGAIVKVVKAIYNFAMFLIERYQQIKDFVVTIYNTLSAIVNGSLSPVIKGVEMALGKAVPVLISLLASLLGLGGIGEKIKEIIGKVTAPIYKGLNALIKKIVEKAKTMFKQGKEAIKGVAGKIVEWWKAKKLFKTASGKSHKLFFKGSRQNAELMIASNPQGLDQLLSERITKEKTPSKKNALTKAVSLKKDLDKFLKQHTKSQSKNNKETESLKQEIDKKLNEIAEQLKVGGLETDDLPLTNVTYSMDAGRAFTINANPLSKIPGNTRGSRPSAKPLGWDHIQKNKKEKSRWVRLHLLNHNLHGPGVIWNLTPGTKEINSQMENEVESKAKSLVDNAKVLFYEVQVFYHDIEGNENFPREIDISWGELEKQNERYIKINKNFKSFYQDIPVEALDQIPILNESSAARLEEAVSGVPWVEVIKVRRGEVSNISGGKFLNSNDFLDRMNLHFKINKGKPDKFFNSFISKITIANKQRKLNLFDKIK